MYHHVTTLHIISVYYIMTNCILIYHVVMADNQMNDIDGGYRYGSAISQHYNYALIMGPLFMAVYSNIFLGHRVVHTFIINIVIFSYYYVFCRITTRKSGSDHHHQSQSLVEIMCGQRNSYD